MDNDNIRFATPLRTAALDTPEGEYETAELMEMGALPDPFQRIAELEEAFVAQFRPLPDSKVSGGHLEVGEFDGSSEYEWETDIEFLLGPDGKVWARIGSLDDLPDDDDEEANT